MGIMQVFTKLYNIVEVFIFSANYAFKRYLIVE